ncbi:MAG: rhombosortase [Paraglaciecola sp.]|uniref:rhombosortase n=1 Tax=Flavobacterium sp. W21_SRS_FM6 TaxID=3240268 RepID=UPI0027429EBC|nr:rhombosortase [Paraglaciecola sp.]
MLTFNLPLARQYVIGPLVLLVVCVLLFLTEPTASHYLAYDRLQIEQFEWWRLFTGNLLHTNANHLGLNLAGVTLLWALHGQYFTARHYLFMLLILSLCTTLGIYFFAKTLQWYVGLSGLLHGVFLLGAYFDIKHGLKTGWLLMIGVIAKVAHEQYFGASQDVANLIAAKVAVDAHLYGTLAGLIIVVLLQLFSIKKASTLKE